MTQNASQPPAVPASPQPTIYTVLVLIAIVVLGVGIGLGLDFLMRPVAEGGYGMSFGQILSGAAEGAAGP